MFATCQRPRVPGLPQIPQAPGEIGQEGGDVGVVRAVGRLVDGQGLFQQFPGVGGPGVDLQVGPGPVQQQAASAITSCPACPACCASPAAASTCGSSTAHRGQSCGAPMIRLGASAPAAACSSASGSRPRSSAISSPVWCSSAGTRVRSSATSSPAPITSRSSTAPSDANPPRRVVMITCARTPAGRGPPGTHPRTSATASTLSKTSSHPRPPPEASHEPEPAAPPGQDRVPDGGSNNPRSGSGARGKGPVRWVVRGVRRQANVARVPHGHGMERAGCRGGGRSPARRWSGRYPGECQSCIVASMVSRRVGWLFRLETCRYSSRN